MLRGLEGMRGRRFVGVYSSFWIRIFGGLELGGGLGGKDLG